MILIFDIGSIASLNGFQAVIKKQLMSKNVAITPFLKDSALKVSYSGINSY